MKDAPATMAKNHVRQVVTEYFTKKGHSITADNLKITSVCGGDSLHRLKSKSAFRYSYLVVNIANRYMRDGLVVVVNRQVDFDVAAFVQNHPFSVRSMTLLRN